MTAADSPCPPWCVADHEAEDERGRRRHRGATITVAGVMRGAHGVPEPTELLMELHREDGDDHTWVFVGDGVRGGLNLTVETAAQLNRQLSFLLDEPGV